MQLSEADFKRLLSAIYGEVDKTIAKKLAERSGVTEGGPYGQVWVDKAGRVIGAAAGASGGAALIAAADNGATNYVVTSSSGLVDVSFDTSLYDPGGRVGTTGGGGTKIRPGTAGYYLVTASAAIRDGTAAMAAGDTASLIVDYGPGAANLDYHVAEASYSLNNGVTRAWLAGSRVVYVATTTTDLIIQADTGGSGGERRFYGQQFSVLRVA